MHHILHFIFSGQACTVCISFCFSFLQAKLAFERLPVLKAFHPFVCGPFNQNIKQLVEETGARINVPPTSVEKDEIVVSGEKEGVAKCKQVIMSIFEEKVRSKFSYFCKDDKILSIQKVVGMKCSSVWTSITFKLVVFIDKDIGFY